MTFELTATGGSETVIEADSMDEAKRLARRWVNGWDFPAVESIDVGIVEEDSRAADSIVVEAHEAA
jgi:hypothetical protein